MRLVERWYVCVASVGLCLDPGVAAGSALRPAWFLHARRASGFVLADRLQRLCPAPDSVTMGCCKKGPTKEELKGMVPDEHRKCQDCFCFILFVLFWIGMIVIAAVSIASGDPNRLLYGVDYQGNTCGQGDMSGKKRIVYPRLSEDLLLNMQDGKIKTNPLDYKFYGICVNECPYASYVLCNADDPLVTDNMSQQQRLHCIDDPNDSTPQCESVRENCWYIPLNMSSIFWRCLPEYVPCCFRVLLCASFSPHTPLAACSYVVTKGEDVRCVFPSGVKDANDPACILRIDETNGTVTRPAQPNLLYDKINQARSLWGRWVGDVARSWWVVALCGVGLALFFGLVYLLLLRCVGGAAAWRGCRPCSRSPPARVVVVSCPGPAAGAPASWCS